MAFWMLECILVWYNVMWSYRKEFITKITKITTTLTIMLIKIYDFEFFNEKLSILLEVDSVLKTNKTK